MSSPFRAIWAILFCALFLVGARAQSPREDETRPGQPTGAVKPATDEQGDPIPEGTSVREVWRGRRRRLKTRDPHARHRWPVERTNSWLRAWRRVDTRWERRPEHWLAVIQIAAAVTIHHTLDSFR